MRSLASSEPLPRGIPSGSPISAIVLPVIVRLPAVLLAGSASGLADTEMNICEHNRHAACDAVGLKGVLCQPIE